MAYPERRPDRVDACCRASKLQESAAHNQSILNYFKPELEEARVFVGVYDSTDIKSSMINNKFDLNSKSKMPFCKKKGNKFEITSPEKLKIWVKF